MTTEEYNEVIRAVHAQGTKETQTQVPTTEREGQVLVSISLLYEVQSLLEAAIALILHQQEDVAEAEMRKLRRSQQDDA
jgi:hypothetical protein